MPRHTKLLAWFLATWLLVPVASAQQVMLDEEFSQAAEKLTNPLRGTLAPGTPVHFVIVADPTINAFVTGENVVYVNSGLVLRAKTAAELQGVLAHELGHITAHHIFQGQTNMQQAGYGAIAGAVLGIGAMAAGAPQVGSAIMMGAQAGAITNLLAHTRTQEQEADRYAINALHNAGYSVQGMVDMFATLRTENQLSYQAPPPWLVTHPLPPERLANLQSLLAQEKSGLKKEPEGVNFERLQAKVAALTNTPQSIQRHYTGTDATSAYARAIALTSSGKVKEAQTAVDALLATSPDDPFYHELAGQLAVSTGKLAEAEKHFTTILASHPSYIIVRYQLAETLRGLNRPKDALAHYERITRLWPEWSEAWQGQGLVYGQLGRLTESHLALTEAALTAGDDRGARQALQLAKSYLKKTPNADQQAWADGLQQRVDRLPPAPATGN